MFCAGSRPKKRKKNIQQRTLLSLITILPSINYGLGSHIFISFQQSLIKPCRVTKMSMMNIELWRRLFACLKIMENCWYCVTLVKRSSKCQKSCRIAIVLLTALLSGSFGWDTYLEWTLSQKSMPLSVIKSFSGKRYLWSWFFRRLQHSLI